MLLIVVWWNKNKITKIVFNPFADNIILMSYINGNCKIYNTLKKNKEDFIPFEGINESSIICPKFNYLNPNIIASINPNSPIIIWNVKEFNLIQIPIGDEHKEKNH